MTEFDVENFRQSVSSAGDQMKASHYHLSESSTTSQTREILVSIEQLQSPVKKQGPFIFKEQPSPLTTNRPHDFNHLHLNCKTPLYARKGLYACGGLRLDKTNRDPS